MKNLKITDKLKKIIATGVTVALVATSTTGCKSIISKIDSNNNDNLLSSSFSSEEKVYLEEGKFMFSIYFYSDDIPKNYPDELCKQTYMRELEKIPDNFIPEYIEEDYVKFKAIFIDRGNYYHPVSCGNGQAKFFNVYINTKPVKIDSEVYEYLRNLGFDIPLEEAMEHPEYFGKPASRTNSK